MTTDDDGDISYEIPLSFASKIVNAFATSTGCSDGHGQSNRLTLATACTVIDSASDSEDDEWHENMMLRDYRPVRRSVIEENEDYDDGMTTDVTTSDDDDDSARPSSTNLVPTPEGAENTSTLCVFARQSQSTYTQHHTITSTILISTLSYSTTKLNFPPSHSLLSSSSSLSSSSASAMVGNDSDGGLQRRHLSKEKGIQVADAAVDVAKGVFVVPVKNEVGAGAPIPLDKSTAITTIESTLILKYQEAKFSGLHLAMKAIAEQIKRQSGVDVNTLADSGVELDRVIIPHKNNVACSPDVNPAQHVRVDSNLGKPVGESRIQIEAILAHLCGLTDDEMKDFRSFNRIDMSRDDTYSYIMDDGALTLRVNQIKPLGAPGAGATRSRRLLRTGPGALGCHTGYFTYNPANKPEKGSWPFQVKSYMEGYASSYPPQVVCLTYMGCELWGTDPDSKEVVSYPLTEAFIEEWLDMCCYIKARAATAVISVGSPSGMCSHTPGMHYAQMETLATIAKNIGLVVWHPQSHLGSMSADHWDYYDGQLCATGQSCCLLRQLLLDQICLASCYDTQRLGDLTKFHGSRNRTSVVIRFWEETEVSQATSYFRDVGDYYDTVDMKEFDERNGNPFLLAGKNCLTSPTTASGQDASKSKGWRDRLAKPASGVGASSSSSSSSSSPAPAASAAPVNKSSPGIAAAAVKVPLKAPTGPARTLGPSTSDKDFPPLSATKDIPNPKKHGLGAGKQPANSKGLSPAAPPWPTSTASSSTAAPENKSSSDAAVAGAAVADTVVAAAAPAASSTAASAAAAGAVAPAAAASAAAPAAAAAAAAPVAAGPVTNSHASSSVPEGEQVSDGDDGMNRIREILNSPSEATLVNCMESIHDWFPRYDRSPFFCEYMELDTLSRSSSN